MKPLLVLLLMTFIGSAQKPQAGWTTAPTPVFTSFTQDAGGDCIFALHADVIPGMTCSNASVDGTTETAFQRGVTIPANSLSNRTVALVSTFLLHTAGGTTPTTTMSLRLGGISGQQIYQSNALAPGGAVTDAVTSFYCTLTALSAASATTPLAVTCNTNTGVLATSSLRNALILSTARTVSVDATQTQALVWTVQYSANAAGCAIGLYSMFNGVR